MKRTFSIIRYRPHLVYINLIIQRRPEDFPMQWHGDEYSEGTLLPPASVYTSDVLPLVSCIQPIVDDIVIPRGTGDVKEFLHLLPKAVTLEQVGIFK